MRRIWLLLIFLLLAQQGALVHGVSHASLDKSTPFEQVCDQCVLYSGVASGAASGHGVFVPQGSPIPFATEFPAFHEPAAFLSFSSRAPPRLL